MMKHSNLYGLLSILSAPSSLFNKNKQGSRLDIRNAVAEEAFKSYDNQTGRWDTIPTIPSRTLYGVMEDEEGDVKAMGAVKGSDGVWTVPDHIPLADFDMWGKPVPKDVVDRSVRMESTKEGKPIENYKLIGDEQKGWDSTAMPIMYGALVVIAALMLAVGKMSLGLALPLALLAIPYIWTIAQSEGLGESARAIVITMVMPIAFSMAGGINPLLAAGVFGSGLVILISIPVLFLIMIFVLGGASTGSVWTKIKQGFWWTSGVLAVGAFVHYMQSFEWFHTFKEPILFGLACMYAMIYSEREHVDRSEKLLVQKIFNLATQGTLNNAHVEIRQKQAEEAANDTTPFLPMGVATGHMTDTKKYPYGADKGNDMGLTALDRTMHVITFGMTGKGKTSTVLRPAAAEMQRAKNKGYKCGLYVDCGKGALAGDLSGILDITVKEGVPFAFYQGLDPEGAEIALNTKTLKNASKDGKDQIWINGAKMLLSHILRIQWSLVHHEKEQKKLAKEKMKHFFNHIASVDASLVRANAVQKEQLEQQRTKLQKHYEAWEKIAIEERQWYWNVDSTETLRQFIDLPRRVDNEWVAGRRMTEILCYLGYNASDRRKTEPRTIHPEIDNGSLLDDSIKYATSVWPSTDEAQRSSFMINAKDILFPLMRSEHMVDQNGVRWCFLEEGVKPEMCLYGMNTATYLPRGIFKESGLLVSALVKQRLHKGFKRRLDEMTEAEWRAEGQTPVMLLWDEAQALVSQEDIELLPLARSGWIMANFATQGYDSLVNAFGSEQAAELFCNTFQSLVVLEASQATYDYLGKRFGTAEMTVFTEQTRGIDYDGATSKYLKSSFNDNNHPNWAVIEKVERQGGARFIVPIQRLQSQMSGFFNPWQVKAGRSNEQEVALGFTANVGGQKEVQPLFKPEEFNNLLKGRGKAFAYLQRAGAPRVDLMTLPHMGPDELRKTKQQQGDNA